MPSCGACGRIGVLLARLLLSARRLELGRLAVATAVVGAVLVVGVVIPLDSQAQLGSLRVGVVSSGSGA